LVPKKQRAAAPIFKSIRVWSPATKPPPKLLAHAHTLAPRDLGISIFSGLADSVEVTVLWPETICTFKCAWPRGARAGSKLVTGMIIYFSGRVTAS